MNVAFSFPKSVFFLFCLERKFFPKKEVTFWVVRRETSVCVWARNTSLTLLETEMKPLSSKKAIEPVFLNAFFITTWLNHIPVENRRKFKKTYCTALEIVLYMYIAFVKKHNRFYCFSRKTYTFKLTASLTACIIHDWQKCSEQSLQVFPFILDQRYEIT